ncbi:putative carbohydrate esterase [Yersinia phage vB_Yru_GN1]|uniref:Carbohydrate esterase n=1 Tax=Yersinia phage vB_Yru_GN1 TaxID=3074381 RepID=A0AA86J0Q0_9CAUD|nr:putative carbohydrate esterase [Yersinia phage vB_Yru_GN1]
MIDDYKGVDEDFLRTPVELFKSHIFELFRKGFIPRTTEEYINSDDDKLSFCINIEGNYNINDHAMKFLNDLGIPITLFYYYNTDVLNNAPLDLSHLYKDGPYDRASYGYSAMNGVILENSDLETINKSIPLGISPFKSWSFSDYSNEALVRLIANKQYKKIYRSVDGHSLTELPQFTTSYNEVPDDVVVYDQIDVSSLPIEDFRLLISPKGPSILSKIWRK